MNRGEHITNGKNRYSKEEVMEDTIIKEGDIITDDDGNKIKVVRNIWSNELVTWDISKPKRPKLKRNEKCVHCDKKAHAMFLFTNQVGKPYCYGYWVGWGCYYTKEMVENDVKYYRQPCRYRNNHYSRPLTNKERKKLINNIIKLEEDKSHGWIPTHRTPKDEIASWHNERLKIEYRMLDQMRSDNGTN